MLRSTKKLRGYTVCASDGDVGKVHEFYFDDQEWTIRYLVVNTGKWLFGRKVLISPVALGQPDWANETFPVSLTKEQVKDSPSVDTEQPVSRKYEAKLHEYYGWPIYWSDAGLIDTGTPAMMHPEVAETAEEAEEEELPKEEEVSNLRSTREVIGYNIQATDGEIGHVDDFIADDENWIIRYAVVDTRDWLPGKEVLIAPDWIEKVRWVQSKIFVELSQEEIKNAPEFDPSAPVNKEYEEELYDYYGRPRYWE